MDKTKFKKEMFEILVNRANALKNDLNDAYKIYVEENDKKPEVEDFFIGWVINEIAFLQISIGVLIKDIEELSKK